MADMELVRRVSRAVSAGELSLVRDLIAQNPQLKTAMASDGKSLLSYWLQNAARANHLEIVKLLVEHGADIHAPEDAGDHPDPEGVIYAAARGGAFDVVKWLLDRGAKINFTIPEYPDEPRCQPLVNACHQGNFEMVKLLVEKGGANVNAYWAHMTPLAYAIAYGHKEIEEYLRSKGALEPHQLPAGAKDLFLHHVEKHLGKLKPLALREIVPGDPPISIHVVPKNKKQGTCLTLVTTGMSARPMAVPAGGEEFQYAEVLMHLPPKWPLTEKALRDPKNFWPIEWLRKIASYPHEHKTWLGGRAAVIANEEPPQPLAPGVPFTCVLVLAESGEFGRCQFPDGRTIVLYMLFPLYTDERDFEKAHGTEALIKLLQQYWGSTCTDVNRPSVVVESEA